jgi:ribonuclease BN (tRNA processing enzyme)
VEKVFLSHDHGDHTLGLPSLIGCRNAAQGMSRNEDTMESHNKPLTVYFPADNPLFHDLFDFIEKRHGSWLRYRLDFVPIEPGFELQIGKNLYIKAIKTLHSEHTTLGYVIYENRIRLKKEFVGQDIRALIKQGIDRSTLHESYRANLFAYCLDAYKIVDSTELTNCDTVIMDCTFLNEKDRTDMTHFTCKEALDLCKSLGVRRMLAAHLSTRYNLGDYIAAFPDDVAVVSNRGVRHYSQDGILENYGN